MSADSSAVVGVNLTWLVPGVVGGSQEYTMRLLDAVGPLLDDRIRLRIYARPELVDTYPDLADRYELITAPGVRSKLARVGLEQSWLAYQSRFDDMVHHAGGTVPFVRLQATAVTIHDLQPLEMPENFHPVKRAWLDWALPYGVRAARLVLCPSQFTARRLNQLLGVPEAKIRVISHGHRPPPSAPQPVNDNTAKPRDRFGRYVLYPAIAYRHKRHRDAVQALARLGPTFDDVALVFTGHPGPELQAVLAEADSLGLAGRVHALGRVPAAELDRLYRSASALVFPSAYEGFGNPVLEAMSLGCPVIASDVGPLPEVVGEAGMVFAVGQVDDLVKALTEVLGDRLVADRLRRLGPIRARQFDSSIAGRQLADVYAELTDS